MTNLQHITHTVKSIANLLRARENVDIEALRQHAALIDECIVKMVAQRDLVNLRWALIYLSHNLRSISFTYLKHFRLVDVMTTLKGIFTVSQQQARDLIGEDSEANRLVLESYISDTESFANNGLHPDVYMMQKLINYKQPKNLEFLAESLLRAENVPPLRKYGVIKALASSLSSEMETKLEIAARLIPLGLPEQPGAIYEDQDENNVPGVDNLFHLIEIFYDHGLVDFARYFVKHMQPSKFNYGRYLVLMERDPYLKSKEGILHAIQCLSKTPNHHPSQVVCLLGYLDNASDIVFAPGQLGEQFFRTLHKVFAHQIVRDKGPEFMTRILDESIGALVFGSRFTDHKKTIFSLLDNLKREPKVEKNVYLRSKWLKKFAFTQDLEL